MTYEKFHFNWLMLTSIFFIWASEPPPRAWRTTEKAGPDRVNTISKVYGTKLKESTSNLKLSFSPCKIPYSHNRLTLKGFILDSFYFSRISDIYSHLLCNDCNTAGNVNSSKHHILTKKMSFH